MTDKPSEDQYRDLFPRFGLAYYESECLYLQLCADFAIADTRSRYDTTRPRIEERFAQALSLTLGELAAQLRTTLPPEVGDKLKDVLDARNFLAHRFWIERSLQVETREGVGALLGELDRYAALFDHVDRMATSWFNEKMQQIGGVDFKLQESFNRVATSSRLDPLPSRRQVQGYDRKLKGTIRIVRAWEVVSERSALVLEEDDGDLWQFCDVGLGWSSFKKVGAEWTVKKDIQVHLPATFRPRPLINCPWDFELLLDSGVKLTVKPGERKSAFLLSIDETNA